jgi:hypothetical protein
VTAGPLPKKPKFATLEKVAVKLGWTHEAHELTPWLAENLDLLSQEIGLALEFRAREHPVGKYWLDLLLADARDRIVIVENQFGATDHDHLGKLLTYCAGTDAQVVIWISESINEEHVAALQWLNENTVADVGFFGVELQLLRIGESPLAPHFNVVVQPNEWSKEKRAATPSTNWTWETYATELGIIEERLAVGKELVSRVEAAITERSLPWQNRFNKGYVAYLRKSGYKTAVVDMWWRKVPRFAVKLPKPPEELGLSSPYPGLSEDWDSAEQEWGWTVSSVEEIPDVGVALNIAAPFHPAEGGPMVIPGSSG